MWDGRPAPGLALQNRRAPEVVDVLAESGLRLHLGAVDYVILGLYFVTVLGIGLLVRRAISTSADHVGADRRLAQPAERQLDRHRVRARLRAVLRVLDDELRGGPTWTVRPQHERGPPYPAGRRLPEAAHPAGDRRTWADRAGDGTGAGRQQDLWVGLAMLALGVLFLIWQWARPVRLGESARYRRTGRPSRTPRPEPGAAGAAAGPGGPAR